MIKLWLLEVKGIKKSAQKLTSWHTLSIHYLPSPIKCSLWPYSYFKLSKLSNESNFVQIRVDDKVMALGS